MAHAPSILDPLTGGTYRPGHPLVPRPRLRRQIVMGIVLVLLTGLIWGYWIATDARRVKAMAQEQLSKALGAKVEIRKASLSLFEGLKLEDVRVSVPDAGGGGDAPDALLFSASRFLVSVNLRAMAAGRLEASQIVAVDPHVYVCENLDDGTWNYQRMARGAEGPAKEPTQRRTLTLPEVVLRAGRVDYHRIARGRYELVGSMAIDGQVTPGGGDVYSFDLESRAPGQANGPRVSGSVNTRQSVVTAKLEHFNFDRTIRAMLPSQVQDWCEAHRLSGRIGVPYLRYEAGGKGEQPKFDVVLGLERVRMAAMPLELNSRREIEQRRFWSPGFVVPALKVEGVPYANPAGLCDAYLGIARPELKDVTGSVSFTQDRISIDRLSGVAVDNRVEISGHVDGYWPEAPLELTMACRMAVIPQSPRYLASMPRDVRNVYADIKPYGYGSVMLSVARTRPGAALDVRGEVQVARGAMTFHDFPYPLTEATGTVTFGRDPQTGWERVDIVDLRGRGLKGTANESARVKVDGFITPLNKRSRVVLSITAQNVTLDAHVRAALPPEAREPVAMFDAPAGSRAAALFAGLATTGPSTRAAATRPVWLHGDFEARVDRPYGLGRRVVVDVDMDLDAGEGAFGTFPYPLRNLRGRVEVRRDHVNVVNVIARQGDSTVSIDGRVGFGGGGPVTPNLKVTARDVKVDEDLTAAMRPMQRKWLEKVGLEGLIDIDGRIFRSPGTGGGAGLGGVRDEDPRAASGEVDFDLTVKLRQGRAWPGEGPAGAKVFAFTDVAGDLDFGAERVNVRKLSARRGPAVLNGSGFVAWPDDRGSFGVQATAKGLALDGALADMLPPGARAALEAARPQGTVDLEVTASGVEEPGEGAGRMKTMYQVTLEPRTLSVTPVAFGWKLDGLAGKIKIGPEAVSFENLSGRHGKATLGLSGTASGGGPWTFDLHATGKNIEVDDELRKALPEGLAGLVKSLGLSGTVGFDFGKMAYGPAVAGPSTRPGAATRPSDRLAFAGSILLEDAALDAGVPLTGVRGAQVELEGTLADGALVGLTGKVNAPVLVAAGRPMKNVRANLLRREDETRFYVRDLRGQLAGGDLAGTVELDLPARGPSRFAVAAVLRNADVRELTQDKEGKFKGSLTASVGLYGNWADPNSRRGRGDIRVEGEDLYKLPVMMGLLNLTNLTLPISTPFREADCSYSVEGQRLTFESIGLRADTMTMQGSGVLDFASRTVRLTFTTDSPKLIKIPVVDELAELVKGQFLQIHVRGKIQEPEAGLKPMNTLTTTVDEVVKGKDSPSPKKKK